MDNKENQFEEMKKEIKELNSKIKELEKIEKHNRDIFEANFYQLYQKITRKKSERRLFILTIIVYMLSVTFVVLVRTGQLNDFTDVIICLIIATIVMVVMLALVLMELRYLIPEILNLLKHRKGRRKQDSKNDMGDKQ